VLRGSGLVCVRGVPARPSPVTTVSHGALGCPGLLTGNAFLVMGRWSGDEGRHAGVEFTETSNRNPNAPKWPGHRFR